MPRDHLDYWLRLRNVDHPLGVREAQRMLGLSSPGKAQRLLNRLVKLGLAERTEEGKYRIVRDPPLELVGKIVVAGRIYPRILVYAAYSTVLAALYVALAKPPLDVILLAVFLTVPLWVEAIIEHKQLRKRTRNTGV